VPLALLVAGLARLPAFLHAPLLRANKGKRRLVVFSHGLAGSRTAYSQYCGELASRGYVVAAIEHRDGSGPSTFSHTVDGKKRLVPFYRETDIS
jgi:platelet-activating factor acetylhydrolase